MNDFLEKIKNIPEIKIRYSIVSINVDVKILIAMFSVNMLIGNKTMKFPRLL